MHSPTGILSFSQLTAGAGTPVTSQLRTRGLPATWLTFSVLGFSNVGGTAGETPDCQSPKTPRPLPSTWADEGHPTGSSFWLVVDILCFAIGRDIGCFSHRYK